MNKSKALKQLIEYLEDYNTKYSYIFLENLLKNCRILS